MPRSCASPEPIRSIGQFEDSWRSISEAMMAVETTGGEDVGSRGQSHNGRNRGKAAIGRAKRRFHTFRAPCNKRPGTIQLTRHGKQRSFSVKDGAGNPVAKIDFVIADDPGGCLPEVARRHLSVSAGQPFGMPLSAENDVGGVIGRLMFGDAVAERW